MPSVACLGGDEVIGLGKRCGDCDLGQGSTVNWSAIYWRRFFELTRELIRVIAVMHDGYVTSLRRLCDLPVGKGALQGASLLASEQDERAWTMLCATSDHWSDRRLAVVPQKKNAPTESGRFWL